MDIFGLPLNLTQLQQNIIAFTHQMQMHIETTDLKQQDCR